MKSNDVRVRLADAVREHAVAERRAQAKLDVLKEAILAARVAGVSWTEIAGHLGVSRQAVADRFGSWVQHEITEAMKDRIGT